MVGFSDVAHCDPCGSCGVTCDVFAYEEGMGEDYFTYFTVLYGTWDGEYDIDDLKPHWICTTSTGGIYLSSYPIDITKSWKVNARFKYTTSLSGGAVWELAGGGLDVNNYLYVRAIVEVVDTDEQHMNFILGRKVSSVDEVLAEFEYSPSTGLNFGTVDEIDVGLELCYNEDDKVLSGTLYEADFSESPVATLSKREVYQLGEYTGVYVHTNFGVIEFYDYVVLLAKDEESPDCSECRLSGCRGIPAKELELEIIDPSPISGIVAPLCTISCSILTAIWNFAIGTISTSSVIAEGGDASCEWYSGPFEDEFIDCVGTSSTETLIMNLLPAHAFSDAFDNVSVWGGKYELRIEAIFSEGFTVYIRTIGKYYLKVDNQTIQDFPMDDWVLNTWYDAIVTPSLNPNYKCSFESPESFTMKIRKTAETFTP